MLTSRATDTSRRGGTQILRDLNARRTQRILIKFGVTHDSPECEYIFWENYVHGTSHESAVCILNSALLNSARAWLHQSIESGEKCGRKLSEKNGLATVTISVFDLLGSLKPMTSFQARAGIKLVREDRCFC